MLLAGGQGSRLGVLTSEVAKPAVSFGGKYSIIDFPLSNCINSGVDTVGVLTQYQPLRLNTHIGIGIPWDLDRNYGGVTVLNNADVTMAAMPVPIEEASRFGVLITDDTGRITDFEEKPAHPRSNLASMGIYIFTWSVLREALITNKDIPNCDFGMHVIPYCHKRGDRVFCYEFNGYWKDVGTLHSYWEANMELIDIVPVFNLYEEFWKIYTKSDNQPPQYIADTAQIERCIIGDGSEIYGRVRNCVIGPEVIVEEGAEVYDSILMQGAVIKKGTKIYKSIIAQDAVVGENCTIGVGEYADSQYNKKVYCCDLVTVAEGSEIPDGVTIGKNVAIAGKTAIEDYPDGNLVSGGYIIKGGEEE